MISYSLALIQLARRLPEMTNREMIRISTAAFLLIIPMINAANKSVTMANPRAAANPQRVKMDTIITNKGMLARVPKITKTTSTM